MAFGKPKVVLWLGLRLGVLEFEWIYLAWILPFLGCTV